MQARRQWPDDEPTHAEVDFANLRIEQAPVLRDGLVDLAPVVISPDQPLGIWHLNGVELAPLVSRLRSEPAEQVLAPLIDAAGATPRVAEALRMLAGDQPLYQQHRPDQQVDDVEGRHRRHVPAAQRDGAGLQFPRDALSRAQGGEHRSCSGAAL